MSTGSSSSNQMPSKVARELGDMIGEKLDGIQKQMQDRSKVVLKTEAPRSLKQNDMSEISKKGIVI